MNQIRKEILAGFTTFITMAYIVVVNPAILSSEGTSMPFSGVLTATVLTCFSMTLLMGLYGKLPFAVAPGMGINAFFSYSIIIGQKVPWPIALGIVFWAGVIFLIISLTSLRESIAKAIPPSIRIGSAAGIGFFLSFIGLKNMGLVVADPVTFVRLGEVNREILISLLGLGVIAFMERKKNPFAFLAGILFVTCILFFWGKVSLPTNYWSFPDFSSTFFKLDILGALQISFLAPIISILFTDLFDSISTFVGVAEATNLKTVDGNPKNLRQGLIVDAWATLTAGLFGTSSGTAYIESAAGIEAGGRTGFTSVVTALCFIPCFFIGPLVQVIPALATAPVLLFVGGLMFRTVGKLNFSKLEEAFPAFLTLLLIPLTFSITQGMLWGFLSHVFLFVISGRKKEISLMLWGIAIVSIGLIVLN